MWMFLQVLENVSVQLNPMEAKLDEHPLAALKLSIMPLKS